MRNSCSQLRMPLKVANRSAAAAAAAHKLVGVRAKEILHERLRAVAIHHRRLDWVQRGVSNHWMPSRRGQKSLTSSIWRSNSLRWICMSQSGMKLADVQRGRGDGGQQSGNALVATNYLTAATLAARRPRHLCITC